MEAINGLWTWLAGLDATFAFLVALPFVIGAFGLAAFAAEHRRVNRPRTAPSPRERPGRTVQIQ